MSKKYELTSEIKQIKHALTRNIINLYRIRALKDFDDVKAGALGGFIEKEVNLSHDGNCWVYDEACVYGHARVYDNAKYGIILKCVVKSMGIVRSMERLLSLNMRKFMTMLLFMVVLMFMGIFMAMLM